MKTRWFLVVLAVAALTGLTGLSAPALGSSPPCEVVNARTHASFTGLQEAVESAKAADTLKVHGRCEGTTEIVVSLHIVGVNSGPAKAVLSGDGSGPVVSIYDGADVTITGLVITDGFAEYGGGIYVQYSSLALASSELTNDYSYVGGGGIYVEEGPLKITNSVIQDNASEGSGGGIYDDSGQLSVSGSKIDHNRSDQCDEGEFRNSDADRLASKPDGPDECQLGRGGGGIYGEDATVTLGASEVAFNESSGEGGGIFAADSSLELTASTVKDNSAEGDGGGIYAVQGALTLNGSTVSGTTPTPGAAGPRGLRGTDAEQQLREGQRNGRVRRWHLRR